MVYAFVSKNMYSFHIISKNNLLVKISILNKFFDQNFKLFNRDIICRILIKADVLDHSQLFIDCNFMRVSENIIALQSTKQYTNVQQCGFFFVSCRQRQEYTSTVGLNCLLGFKHINIPDTIRLQPCISFHNQRLKQTDHSK